MECDVVVVGLGPGGEEAAGKLAESGLNVVGVEAELLGGECPYWGCIPSKMMVRAADLLAEGRRIPGNGGSWVGEVGQRDAMPMLAIRSFAPPGASVAPQAVKTASN